MKKSILFYTIVFVIVFILLHFVLSIFSIQFRYWVYYVAILATVLGILSGIIQIIVITKNKRIKIVVSIITTLIGIGLVIISPIILLLFAFSYTPEHVVRKEDGKKYVAYVKSFLHVDVYYCNYINPFIVGNKVKIHEYYGNGGYDPFDKNQSDRTVKYYYYYDDNGNIIETNSESDKIENEIKETKIITKTNTNTNETQNINEEDIIYEKKINNKVTIRVLYKESVLAQRSIVVVTKTIDGGKTWTEQRNPNGDFIQIHNGAKFFFLDENIGFINDFGLAGTAGENRGLSVTFDGGKSFEDVKINTDKENIHIEDTPYVENNILKFKAYTLKNSEKEYYIFSSQDNGRTWTEIKK